MVALTIQSWHWLMTVAELLSLACYIASLVFLHEFIGNLARPSGAHAQPAQQAQGPQLGEGGGPRGLVPVSSRPLHSAALLVSLASLWSKALLIVGSWNWRPVGVISVLECGLCITPPCPLA